MHKLHKWPSEYDALPRHEKAFVIAAVQIKREADEQQEKDAKKRGNGKGRRKR
ncbi:hypothetical protein [Lysinibacillus sp. CTST325]